MFEHIHGNLLFLHLNAWFCLGAVILLCIFAFLAAETKNEPTQAQRREALFDRFEF